MSRLFPLRSEPELDDREPRLVELDEDAADEVFDALGSATARQILLELHEDPRPASEIATAVDTSVQNVQYHLEKLQAAALVEVVDEWYAKTGTEMKVYAPTDEALVLFAGEEPAGSLRRLLERLVGAIVPVLVGVVFALRWYHGGGDGRTVERDPTGNQSAPILDQGGGSGVDPLVIGIAVVAGGLLALCGYLAVAWIQQRS